MKKNKIVMSVISGLLVAAVAVGGTLAYLSDTSNQVTNTFNVGTGYEEDEKGHVGLWLDETAKVGNENPTQIDTQNRDEDGVEYTDLYPGDIVAKDPTFHLTEGSIDSYVFAEVTGLDAMIDADYVISYLGNGAIPDVPEQSAINPVWKKVADYGEEGGLDGVYIYDTTVGGLFEEYQPVKGGDNLMPLFQTVKLSSTVGNEAFENMQGTMENIVIRGVAVQYANTTAEAAQDEAEIIFENWGE